MSALILASLLVSVFASAQPAPQLTQAFLDQSSSAERLKFYEQMVQSAGTFHLKGHRGQHFEAPSYKPIVEELIRQQKSWLKSLRSLRELRAKQPVRPGHVQAMSRLKEQEETFIRLQIIGEDLLAINLPYSSILRYARLHAMAVSGYELDVIFADSSTLWNVKGWREIAALIAESPKIFLIPLPFALSPKQLNLWQDVPVAFLDLAPSRKEPSMDSSLVARFAKSGQSAYLQWFGAGSVGGDFAQRLTGSESSSELAQILEERSREWNELLDAIEKNSTPAEIELVHFLLFRWHNHRSLGLHQTPEALFKQDKMIRFGFDPDTFQDQSALKKAYARLHQVTRSIVSGNFNSICISLFNDLDKEI